MMQKLTAMATALVLAAATLAPTGAEARERRDGYHDGYQHDGYSRDRHRRDYYDYRRHRRDRDDHDDALAAGVIGLVLGLALGAAASESRAPEARCSDDYRTCEPPQGAKQGGYDPRYDDGRGAYERDYGVAPAAQCTRRERQWDRYANRYLMVDVPC